MDFNKQLREICDRLISDYLVDTLVRYVEERIVIPNEYLNALVVRSIDVARKEDRNEISPKFSKLSDLVSLYTREHQYEYLSVCENMENKEKFNYFDSKDDRTFVFQMGELSACVSMLNDVIHKWNIKEAEENNQEFFYKNIIIFNTICDTPGITHRNLAEKACKTPSGLTNFINRIRPFGYIVQSSLGRSKHYYITEKGKTLLNEYKKTTINIPSIIKTMVRYKSSFYDSDDMLCNIKDSVINNGIEEKSLSYWCKNRLSFSGQGGDESLIVEYASFVKLKVTSTRKNVTSNEVISLLLGDKCISFD